MSDETSPTHEEVQLALYLNARDTAESGTANWGHLPIDAQIAYLQDARAILGAVAVLGFVKSGPITDAQVRAAAKAMYDIDAKLSMSGASTLARAALEAARAAS